MAARLRSDMLKQRINLRLTDDTYDAYREAAEAMGSDVTSIVRQVVEAGVPSMQMVAQAFSSLKAGNVLTGVNVTRAMLESLTAQNEAMREQMRGLAEEVEHKTAVVGAQAKSA